MRQWRYAVVVLAILVAGCATTGTNENGIAIDTVSNQQAVTGASCVVSNSNGSWTVVTPAKVDPGSANSDLRVVCNKAGYRTSEFVFQPAYQSTGSSFGIGVGGGGRRGGVGFGLNLPIGGAGRIGNYPSRVTVEMSPQ